MSPLEQTHHQLIFELKQKKLKRLTLNPGKAATVHNPKNAFHTGERGGRDYIRSRADGTTYRDYT